jgi:hypothetical protein
MDRTPPRPTGLRLINIVNQALNSHDTHRFLKPMGRKEGTGIATTKNLFPTESPPFLVTVRKIDSNDVPEKSFGSRSL